MKIKSAALAVFVAFGATAASAQTQSQTFDFTNKPTTQGLQEIATILRTVGNIKQLSINSSAVSVTVTGTTDELAMSGWIIHALDQPAPPATTAPPQQYLVAGKSDDVIRVFHLTHASPASPQQIQEILTVLRTVADIQKVFSYTALEDLVVRGAANEIAFAQYLVNSLDVEKGSVATSQEFDLQAPYQNQQVARVFYLKNANTPQATQEIMTVLRTVADVQKMFNYTAVNGLAVCGTASDIAAVQWLIQSIDIAQAPKADPSDYQMPGAGKQAPSVIHVFYPSNMNTPKQQQETLTALRTNLSIQKTFNLSKPSVLVVRGSADQVAKAEQLIQSRDTPQAQ